MAKKKKAPPIPEEDEVPEGTLDEDGDEILDLDDVKDDLETAAKILHETHKRFDLPVKEIEEIKQHVEKYVEGKIGVDRINSIKEYIFNILDKNIMQRKMLKEVNQDQEKKLVG